MGRTGPRRLNQSRTHLITISKNFGGLALNVTLMSFGKHPAIFRLKFKRLFSQRNSLVTFLPAHRRRLERASTRQVIRSACSCLGGGTR